MIVPPDQYYVTRFGDTNYADYWDERADPDGVLRDRLSEHERLLHLSDVSTELVFVGGLQPGRILDVGCGPGWFLAELSDEWEKHGTELCQTAAEKARDAGVVVGTPNGQYDVVRCHHVIEHMQQPIHELIQMVSVLRQGGWFLLSTPDFGSPAAVRFCERYRMLHDKTHCSLFTTESLFRFVRDHGLTVRDVDYPFPDRFATWRVMDWYASGKGVSPPWPGSWMTMYCTK